MKILQVIPYFIPAYSYGGPVKVCSNISEELVRRGHEITVVTTDTLDGKNRIKKLTEDINGIEVIRFRNISNRLAKNCNGYLPLGFYSWARDNLKNFDVVHCHDFFTLQNIVTAHLCKEYSIPFIVQPHGTLSPLRQNARFNFAKKFFLKLFPHILKNSKNIIALTKNERMEIISIGKTLENKIEIIPNGLKPEEFKNIEKRNLHREYKIPKKNKIVGYFGRIQYIKGIDISLEVLARLRNRTEFTYLIIGPDEGEREKLEKQIKDLGLENQVTFTGILTGNGKWETLKACDVVLFTSRSEGLPMTVLETAALGVPQIISKECHVPEITEYNAGLELELSDTEGFKNSLLNVLSNKHLQDEFSQNSKKMIAEYFSIERVCDKIEKLME